VKSKGASSKRPAVAARKEAARAAAEKGAK
jgi:hypothetical protein